MRSVEEPQFDIMDQQLSRVFDLGEKIGTVFWELDC